MRKRVFILDTSLFVNPDSGRSFGDSPTAAFLQFLTMIQGHKQLEFWMPPSIYTELMHFVEESAIPHKLLLSIQKRPNKKQEIKINRKYLHKMVEEVRDRTDRSLRLAEKSVRDALYQPVPPKGEGYVPGEVRADAQAIARLRENFRRMTREGMLDSGADMDLLLLAYESGATLISCDQGVIHWAHELGIQTLSHKQLVELIRG